MIFEQSKAERAIGFFEMLRHTKGRFYGQPFTLLDWQMQIIRDVYGTMNETTGYRQYKYAYLEIPKKNGKSELAAGAGLYHTFFDGEINGEVYGCAADRAQASIVFDVAVDMIDQFPALKKRTRLTLSQHKLMDKKTGTVYKVVSAEAYTKHGLNVSACIFDELHAQPNRDLWDVMTFGAGDARTQPIWWVITTAGDDPDRVSIGWEQHEYAARILAGEIVDPSWYPVIYSYDGDDIYNEENWYKANPSLDQTITIEGVREAAEKAKNKPADARLFRWLRLNQWTTSKLTSWLPLELFDRAQGDWNRADLLGKKCYLGLDLSSTIDLTALAVLFPPQEGQEDWRVIWHCWIPRINMLERIERDHVPYDQWAAAGWITVTDGDVVDYTKVEESILECKKFYRVIEVDADRALASMLLQRLEQAGLTCVDVPQTYASLTDPMNQLEIFLKGNREAAANEAGWVRVDDELVDYEKVEVRAQTEGEEEQQPVPSLTGPQMKTGRLTHDGNLVARWCFGNTSIAKNGQGLIKFVKEHRGKSVDRTKRIDLIAALVDAMARARYYETATSVYERRGIRTI